MKLCFALFILALVKGSMASTSCKQKKGATHLTSFWGRKIKISMPCKYNAVRQKCGKYFINVTPGLISTGSRFRLHSAWFSVGNASRPGTKWWEGRTTNKQAVKYINGKTNGFLCKKGGSMETSALFNFTIEREGGFKIATATEKDNVFIFTFTPWEPNNDAYKKSWWTFTCNEDIDDDIAPYPDQVCGGNKDSGFRYGKKFVNDFGLNARQMFLYNVFAETGGKITQVNDQCIKAEDIFQNTCPDNATRKDAIITCGQILTATARRKCVTKYSCSPMDVFVDCLEWACGGYTNDTLCDSVASSTDFCNVSFPDGNLTGKIEAANCYTDYMRIEE